MKFFYIASILSLVFTVSFIVFTGHSAEAVKSNSEPENTANRPLPLIDRNPPKKFETASFGLG